MLLLQSHWVQGGLPILCVVDLEATTICTPAKINPTSDLFIK